MTRVVLKDLGEDLGSAERCRFPVHDATWFVLVRPHYPENVGAVARAIKTMGFFHLALVKPSRLATPEHEMALKMAVKSGDVLRATRQFTSLREALRNRSLIVATTSRRGVTSALLPRSAARLLAERAAKGACIALLFGNEKSGLSKAELRLADLCVRIPMAADQPSVNLAQAAQLIAYELFLAALEAPHPRRLSLTVEGR
ncbi:MAG TPA: RNA methyltransferase [Polyangiaceae bacterium]